jgi:hypothetical protein
LTLVAVLLQSGIAFADSVAISSQPTNTVVSLTDNHCSVQFEFGSIYGAGYAKIRMVNPAPDLCLVRSQVVATRGSSIVNGAWSAWSLLGGPSAGTHLPSTDWEQSTLPDAVGFGANFQISLWNSRTGRVDSVNVSAF